MRKGRYPESTKQRSVLSVIIFIVMVICFVILNRNDLFQPGAESNVIRQGNIGGTMKVTFLDVGQGDSTLVQVKEGNDGFVILIDASERGYGKGIKEYLQGYGIEKIDLLINTHQHADHIGGMREIVKSFDIGEIYMPYLPKKMVPTTAAYEKFLDEVNKKKYKIQKLYAGVEADTPKSLKMSVLSPEKNAEYSNLNNYSGVIHLQYGEISFLVTGDAEKEVENILFDSGAGIEATVLRCGHHGSYTSTASGFLKKINPKYVVISCGRENTYGYPHEETLKKLGKLGCEIYRTDLQRTIAMKTDGRKIEIETNISSIPKAD